MSFSVLSCKNLFVSHLGHNTVNCGNESSPCQNISYIVYKRATADDLIYVEATTTPYIIKSIIPLYQSVSLVGYKGAATIKLEYGHPLFQYSIFWSGTNVSIFLENLFFYGGGAIRKMSGSWMVNYKFSVKISNCSFKNVPNSVVSSLADSTFSNGFGTDLDVIIDNSSFYGCGGTVYVSNKVRNLVIAVSRSSIQGSSKQTGVYFRQTGIDIIGAETVSTDINILETNFTHLLRCLLIRSATSLSKVTIHRSIFIGNGEPPGSLAIHTPSTVSITNSTFMNNTGITILIFSKSQVELKNSHFLHNRGGAYHQAQSSTTFTNCHFEGNGETQYGGAIYNDLSSFCRCENCTFVENTASISGGTVYHAPFASKLQMINCHIDVGRKAPSHGYGGEVLYLGLRTSGGCDDTFIKNTTVAAAEGFYTYPSQRALLFVNSVCMENVTVRCPVGWNTSVFATFLSPDYDPYYQTVTTSCSSCPPKTYSVHSSNVLISPAFKKGYRTDQIHCYPCPYGGRCSNGIVRAQNNFWGHQLKGKFSEVRFVRCPVDYCCFGDQCQTYKSCNYNRVGILCGQCKEGYSEDTLSSDCIPNAKCSKVWFWIIFGCAGILYVIFFMYMKEIILCIGKILNLRSMLQFRSKKNDLHTPLMQDEDSHARRIATVRENSKETALSDEILYSGLIKIIFLFYQIQALFNTSLLTRQHVKEILWASREVISSIFNLKINGAYIHRASFCGFTREQAVSKEVLKLLFIIYIIVVFGIIGSLSECFRRRKKAPQNVQSITPFQDRVVSSLLQTLLLGYSVLTMSTMTLLRCQFVYGFGRVLFIDGHVSCFTRWQYILFAVLVVWIVPFPLAIYLSSRGLTEHKLSIKRFFLAITFPLGFIIQLIYFYLSHRKRNQIDDQSDSEEPDSYQSQHSDHTEAILKILQGPFRKATDPSTGNLVSLHWEAVLILRRLALIFVYTFVLNPVIQLYLMLFLLSLFLFHHEYVLPFSNRLLNRAESVSLMSLCLICALGITQAYNYAYPLTSSENFVDVLYVFSYIETFFLTAIPMLIALYILIAVLVRFLHVLWIALKIIKSCGFICWKAINRH